MADALASAAVHAGGLALLALALGVLFAVERSVVRAAEARARKRRPLGYGKLFG